MMSSIRIALIFGMLIAVSTPVAAEIATSPDASPSVPAPADPKVITPEDYVLQPRTVAYIVGKGKWDDAETLLDTTFKAIYAATLHQNIHSTGVPMVEYLDSDDSSFSFKAMVPVDAPAGTALGQDVQIGSGPQGKVLKFVYRGSFDDLEQVYNRIDDYLASKDLAMTRVVEEYITDQAVTPPNELITNIYVFTQ